MVKRYDLGDDGLDESIDGYWMSYDDHRLVTLSLREALREALEGWEFWNGEIGPHREKIDQLRKQFLGD